MLDSAKYPYYLLIVALLGIGGYFAVTTQERGGETTNQAGMPELAAYFENQMINLGRADIGQPIEGFDATLLMLAFPGLDVEDFRGVETLEGRYEVQEGELSFILDREQPVSSAARTLAAKGYETLLANVVSRLGFVLNSESDIDALVGALNTGEHVEARIGAVAEALGVRVTPHEVLEDSRCPVDVECVHAGTVRVRATLASGLGTADQTFELNKPITTEAEFVTLVRVEPIAREGVAIEAHEYVFHFRIQKRSTKEV